MNLKQFRVRDVIINLPIEIEHGTIMDCAESPSRPGCIDGESILCQGNITRGGKDDPPFILCWKGGPSHKICSKEISVCGAFITEPPCEEGSLTKLCGERVSPRVEIQQCDVGYTWTDCGQTETPLTPQTPVIDTLNTPVVYGKLGAARDLVTFKHELGKIMKTLDLHGMPKTEAEIDAVEKHLRLALDDVLAQRQAKE